MLALENLRPQIATSSWGDQSNGFTIYLSLMFLNRLSFEYHGLNMENEIITSEEILSRIYVIRGKRVMLDRDLAELYRVETKRLKESVKRNIERFPEDFMFQLTKQDLEILRSQIATLKRQGRGQHSKYPPYAFSEHGILMLSSVLRSDRAIQVNINIMRAFTQVRDMITNHKDLVQRIDEMEQKYDDNFRIVFDAIRQLVNPPEGKKSKIGFKV
jgi:hypothetical protein